MEFVDELANLDQWEVTGPWHASSENQCLPEAEYRPDSAALFNVEAPFLPPPPPLFAAVEDGGFETALPNAYWSEGGNGGLPVICNEATCGVAAADAAYRGDGYAWLARSIAPTGPGQVDAHIEQDVALADVANATLSFYLKLIAGGIPGTMRLIIDGDTVNPLWEIRADTVYPTEAYADFVRMEVDLAAFADGATHTLRFEATSFQNTGVTGDSFLLDAIICILQDDPADPNAYYQSFCQYSLE